MTTENIFYRQHSQLLVCRKFIQSPCFNQECSCHMDAPHDELHNLKSEKKKNQD